MTSSGQEGGSPGSPTISFLPLFKPHKTPPPVHAFLPSPDGLPVVVVVMMARVQRPSRAAGAAAAADTASWYCAVLLVALILLGLFNQERPTSAAAVPVPRRSCDEIYVVEEGETLHTISDKCGDPYIVERNPHIHDPDDVFPGLVIRLSPSTRS